MRVADVCAQRAQESIYGGRQDGRWPPMAAHARQDARSKLHARPPPAAAAAHHSLLVLPPVLHRLQKSKVDFVGSTSHPEYSSALPCRCQAPVPPRLPPPLLPARHEASAAMHARSKPRSQSPTATRSKWVCCKKTGCQSEAEHQYWLSGARGRPAIQSSAHPRALLPSIPAVSAPLPRLSAPSLRSLSAPICPSLMLPIS